MIKDMIKINFYKNSKLIFYVKNIIYFLLPAFYYKIRKNRILKNFDTSKNKEYILNRVNYYNKKDNDFIIDENSKTIKEFYYEKKKTYFFDIFYIVSLFSKNLKISYIFGDVKNIPKSPSFVKSRPINDINENSILLKLNKVRHFIFVNDKLDFKSKKNLAVWRGNAFKKHRIEFLEKCCDSRYCDVGATNHIKENTKLEKSKLTIKKQLEYKFILSIEGNDVASNLKWAMSSHSLVFMTKPKYETWFMEGTLKENFHYVLLKDDYSDLEEKIKYYIENTEEALSIIKNANEYVEQFKNKDTEDIISYLVVDKFFMNSNQYKKVKTDV